VDGAEGLLYTVDGSGNRCEVLDIVKAYLMTLPASSS
jgi:hypothetical protein